MSIAYPDYLATIRATRIPMKSQSLLGFGPDLSGVVPALVVVTRFTAALEGVLVAVVLLPMVRGAEVMVAVVMALAAIKHDCRAGGARAVMSTQPWTKSMKSSRLPM